MNINTQKMEKLVNDARSLAVKHSHAYVTADHLLAVLLLEDEIIEFLNQNDIDHQELTNDLEEVLTTEDIHGVTRSRVNPDLTNLVAMAMQNAVAIGMNTNDKTVTALHLLTGMILIPEDKAEAHAFVILKAAGVTQTKIKTFQMETGMDGESSATIKDEETAQAFLKQFTKNLNEEAKNARIDPLIGRKNEVSDIILKVARRTKNNVIVVGEPGVGKTAVIEGLAKMIVDGNVPATIANSTIYSLSIADLIAGTKYRGEAEQRIRDLVVALSHIPNPILFIDEIHMMMGAGAGSNSSLDMSNILKPALARGRLRCIGATTHAEYTAHIEKDRALMRRFQLLQVEEPSLADCKDIIRGIAPIYEEFHGITYTEEAMAAAVDLSDRYIQNRLLPDKAIDVLDAAGARQRVRGEEKDTTITISHIRDEVGNIAKIPVSDLTTDDLEKVRNLDGTIKKNVLGQDSAVNALVDTVMISKTGLRSRKKTQGSFLMTGPSGVGKTELAKQLSDSLQMKLIRFDMSEYREPHSISKLIGSPPGYVGYDQGGAGSGLLTGEVEKYPHSVVLFDEIEKAHPDIFNLFLQLIDEGSLTNSSGKKISFENCYVLMTSNVGAAEAAQRSVGFVGSEYNVGASEEAVKKMFKPEFRNRLDGILRFDPLTRESMLGIVSKFIKELSDQMNEQGFVLVVTDAAKEQLAKEGYDPAMGARPLQRVISEKVKKPISRKIVFDCVAKGSVIVVDYTTDYQVTVGSTESEVSPAEA